MKNVTIAAGAILVLGLIFSSCATESVAKTDWAEYTVIPSKNYTVVGAIVVRATGFKTLNADLMEKAISMGAHDIINVRVDLENGQKILAASAVAIKYTDQTLTDKTTNTTTANNTSTTITNETNLVKNNSSGGIFGSDSKKKKKFFGIF